jgi:Uma2 family endonuclease
LLSPSDARAYTVAKCEEYVATGSRVAVLLDPRDRTVTLYRNGRAPVVVPDATLVDIGEEMPGFTLDAAAVFAEFDSRPSPLGART